MHFKLFPELSVIQFNADMSSVKTIFFLDCHHFFTWNHILHQLFLKTVIDIVKSYIDLNEVIMITLEALIIDHFPNWFECTFFYPVTEHQYWNLTGLYCVLFACLVLTFNMVSVTFLPFDTFLVAWYLLSARACIKLQPSV